MRFAALVDAVCGVAGGCSAGGVVWTEGRGLEACGAEVTGWLSIREKPRAKCGLGDKTAGLPIDGVKSCTVKLLVVGDRQGLASAVGEYTPELDMTAPLAEVLKSKFRENAQHLSNGQNPQLRHWVTALAL